MKARRMSREDRDIEFYNKIWRFGSVQKPQTRSTWKLVKKFQGKKCLEIGCGNTPIIPLKNGFFLDASQSAVDNLETVGLNALLGTADKIPFKNSSFDLVVAWHVLEHVKNDKRAFSQISRVLKRGGYFLLAVPIWKKKFTEIDKICGHRRRYEWLELKKILRKNCFEIEKHQASKGFLGMVLKKPLFFPVTVKIYRRIASGRPLKPPKFLVNWLTKFAAFSEKLASSNWKDGEPVNVERAENIALFCRKRFDMF